MIKLNAESSWFMSAIVIRMIGEACIPLVVLRGDSLREVDRKLLNVER